MVTGSAETPLQMARRHVREGEKRVAQLAETVYKMRARGVDMQQAERLLRVYQELLEQSRVHLAREERLAARDNPKPGQ